MSGIFNNFFLGGVFISIFNSVSSIFAPLPLFILKLFFNIGYYVIKNDENKVNKIIKQLEKTTSSTITLYEFGKIKPTGIFIGWKYIGMYHDLLSDRETKRELHLFTFSNVFNKLVKDDKEDCVLEILFMIVNDGVIEDDWHTVMLSNDDIV